MAGGKVNWYENDALLQIDTASNELVTKLAFLVEGYAKTYSRVDTGFMRNAIYTIPATGRTSDTGWESGMYRSRETGEMVQRERVNTTPNVPPRTAAVHAAAEYTIYREMEDHMLYRALETVRRDTPGVIREVGRQRL